MQQKVQKSSNTTLPCSSLQTAVAGPLVRQGGAAWFCWCHRRQPAAPLCSALPCPAPQLARTQQPGHLLRWAVHRTAKFASSRRGSEPTPRLSVRHSPTHASGHPLEGAQRNKHLTRALAALTATATEDEGLRSSLTTRRHTQQPSNLRLAPAASAAGDVGAVEQPLNVQTHPLSFRGGALNHWRPAGNSGACSPPPLFSRSVIKRRKAATRVPSTSDAEGCGGAA